MRPKSLKDVYEERKTMDSLLISLTQNSFIFTDDADKKIEKRTNLVDVQVVQTAKGYGPGKAENALEAYQEIFKNNLKNARNEFMLHMTCLEIYDAYNSELQELKDANPNSLDNKVITETEKNLKFLKKTLLQKGITQEEFSYYDLDKSISNDLRNQVKKNIMKKFGDDLANDLAKKENDIQEKYNYKMVLKENKEKLGPNDEFFDESDLENNNLMVVFNRKDNFLARLTATGYSSLRKLTEHTPEAISAKLAEAPATYRFDKNGRCVPKDVPNGLFAKIGYYLNRFFSGATKKADEYNRTLDEAEKIKEDNSYIFNKVDKLVGKEELANKNVAENIVVSEANQENVASKDEIQNDALNNELQTQNVVEDTEYSMDE